MARELPPALPPPDPSQLDQKELHKKLIDSVLQERLEERKAELAEDKAVADRNRGREEETSEATIAQDKAHADKELELRGAYHQKIAELAAGAIERARDSAKFVQTAAAALMGAYVALLGLVFSVTGKPLPLRGVYSSFFFALSIALGIAYLAFMTKAAETPAYEPRRSYAETQIARTQAFVNWTHAGASKRRYAMRASVVAFAFGVLFIPAAFVGPSINTATAAPPTPPAIPTAVPDAIADDATRLFEAQVEAYFAALEAEPAVAQEAKSCTGLFQTLKSCAWLTETDVERSTQRLAVLAVLIVLLVPLAWLVAEKIG